MQDTGRELSASVDTGRSEHVSNVLRIRKAAVLGVCVWPMFAVADWFVVTYVHPGRLWIYLALRGIGCALLLVGVIRLFANKMVSPRELRFWEVTISAGLCGLIAGQSLEYGGIASPLAMGAILIVLGRGTLVTEHWKRGLLPTALITSTYGVTQIVMGVLRTDVAVQFSDPRLLATFALFQAFLFAAAGITLGAGHLLWRLKRAVFEQRSLGRYKLKRRIGAGGMGEVWSAHHGALKRDVAIKVLRPETSADSQAVARFEREVRATSELNHPHTVRVFDYGTTSDGLWYYVMELLEGMDLRALVSKDGPLHPARATKIVWQAAKALGEAHQRQITHRDIKPENLFVTQVQGEGDFVKVLDFGLAKLTETEGNVDLTTAGWAVGTPKYVSPEVVNGEPATSRSDVYGLGAVLYYTLCGAPPFDHSELKQVLIAQLTEIPLRPSEKLGRRIPPALEAVVMRCLNKEPARRYKDAAELAIALEEAAALSEGIIHTRTNIQPGDLARAATSATFSNEPTIPEAAPATPADLAAGSEEWSTVPLPNPPEAKDDKTEAEETETVVDYRLPPF